MTPRRCVLCFEPLKQSSPWRRVRRDKLCCSARCRQRMRRRRAANQKIHYDLPGQQHLPLADP
jgi:hypothetical protein